MLGAPGAEKIETLLGSLSTSVALSPQAADSVSIALLRSYAVGVSRGISRLDLIKRAGGGEVVVVGVSIGGVGESQDGGDREGRARSYSPCLPFSPP